MSFGYHTVYTAPDYLQKAGFGKVAMLPCIFDGRPSYHRLSSRFLIDRGLGIWTPKKSSFRKGVMPPSAKSLKNYADRLCNFLEWCDVRGIDPLVVEYVKDLIGGYQLEMLQGAWSSEGRPLGERTINARVNAAIDFLDWATDKNLRAPLSVPTVLRTYCPNDILPSEYLTKTVQTRRGKLRESKRRLGFPNEVELSTWYESLLNRPHRGACDALIAELILETAIRREEAACWRLDTLPHNPDEWRILNPNASEKHQAVLVDLQFGTKGPDYGFDHGDKIGPRGSIRLPLRLAWKLHCYRSEQRPKALAIAVATARTLFEQKKIHEQTVHLFLNPLTGKRYSGNNIYEMWRSVARPRGWSPHKARDYWACSLLWRRVKDRAELVRRALKSDVDEVVLQALKSNVLSVIQLEIQPQLRHKSTETTMIYLQWVVDRIGINLNLFERWAGEIGPENVGDQNDSPYEE